MMKYIISNVNIAPFCLNWIITFYTMFCVAYLHLSANIHLYYLCSSKQGLYFLFKKSRNMNLDQGEGRFKRGREVEGGGACHSMQTEWMDEMEILGGMVRIDDVAGTPHAVDWRDKSEISFVRRELRFFMYYCHLSSNYSESCSMTVSHTIQFHIVNKKFQSTFIVREMKMGSDCLAKAYRIAGILCRIMTGTSYIP
jgi:hypothetical protein